MQFSGALTRCFLPTGNLPFEMVSNPESEQATKEKWTPQSRWSVASLLIGPGLLCLLILAGWIVSRQSFSNAYQARTEDGIFEWLTVVLYAVAAVLSLVLWIRHGFRLLLYLAILIILMGLREMDFHERFTEEKISSIRYWRSGEESLLGKFAYATAIGLLVFTMVKLGKAFMSAAKAAWWEKNPVLPTVAAFPLFAGVAFIIDNRLETEFIDKANEITETHRLVLFFSLCEETIEMGLPILIILALIQWDRSRAKGTGGEGLKES